MQSNATKTDDLALEAIKARRDALIMELRRLESILKKQNASFTPSLRPSKRERLH